MDYLYVADLQRSGDLAVPDGTRQRQGWVRVDRFRLDALCEHPGVQPDAAPGAGPVALRAAADSPDRLLAAAAATAGRPAMKQLRLYYDERCGLCTALVGWLRKQRQLVPIECAPKPPGQTDLAVLSESGEVWTGDSAWLIV